MTQIKRIIALLLAVGSLAACFRAPKPAQDSPLLGYFTVTPLQDTLRFLIPDEPDSTAHGKPIPANLFFGTLKPFFKDMEHVADSSVAAVLPLQRFSLNDSIEACVVDIRQFWFQHQSMLLYNKHQHRFTGRETLAEWYGGESGQDLTGSWMLDYDGDGHKDLVRRLIQHYWVIPENGEPVEHLEESADLLLWKNGGFMETPTADSAALVRRFSIQGKW